MTTIRSLRTLTVVASFALTSAVLGGIALAGATSACQTQPFGGPVPVPPPGSYQDRMCMDDGPNAGTCMAGPDGCLQAKATGGMPSICKPGTVVAPGTIEYQCTNLLTGSW